jgi:hypothetical protein
MLRIIFGPKKEEVTEGQRKEDNGELRNLCSFLNIVDIK